MFKLMYSILEVRLPVKTRLGEPVVAGLLYPMLPPNLIQRPDVP